MMAGRAASPASPATSPGIRAHQTAHTIRIASTVITPTLPFRGNDIPAHTKAV